MSLPESIRRIYEIYEHRTGKKVKRPDFPDIENVPAKKSPKHKETKAPVKDDIEIPVFKTETFSLHDKIWSYCDYMQNTGGIIAPERDIKLGKVKILELNENGILKYETTDTALNSRMTFGILTLLLGGTMLYFGAPGSGKTAEISGLAHLGYNAPYDKFKQSVVTCNGEQTFSDVFAYADLGELFGPAHRELFKKHPVLRSEIIFFDEIEKGNKNVTDRLLELLQDASITYRGQRFKLFKGPFYFAANSITNLSEALVDRVNVIVDAATVDPHFIDMTNNRKNYKQIIENAPHLEKGDLAAIRKEANSIPLDDETKGFLPFFLSQIKYCIQASKKPERQKKDNLPESERPSLICTKTNCKYLSESYICNMTTGPVSVRTYQSIYKYTKGFAWLRGARQATIKDLKAVLPRALREKIKPTSHALDKDQSYRTDSVAFIEDLVDKAHESYGDMVSKLPKYAQISDTINSVFIYGTKPGLDAKEIETMMNDLKKVDSPVVAGLVVTLDYIKSVLSCRKK